MFKPHAFAVLASLLIPQLLTAAAQSEWLPVTPQDLAISAPALEPGAPAEILFRKIELDDRDMPNQSVIRQYVRFKVYQPERAEAFTRISGQEDTTANGYSESGVKLDARLILPDGTVKIFGDEAVRERVLQQSAGEKTFLRSIFSSDNGARKEKFLAIDGIVAGAIIEYHIETTLTNRYYAFLGYALQARDIPTRHVEFRCQAVKGTSFGYRCFLLNKGLSNATVVSDAKAHEVRITADNLPSLPQEPLSGVPSNYALLVLNCYKKTESNPLSRSGSPQSYDIDAQKTGAWSPKATEAYVAQVDCAVPTPRVKKIAAELTAHATTPAEKARIIHQYAQERRAEFRKLPPRKFDAYTYAYHRIMSLDDVLDYAQKPGLVGAGSADFLWLAMAMYESVGLECRSVLIPDSRFVAFNRQLVADALLQEPAAIVKLDGHWLFSYPNAPTAIPFGSLPWYCEGQQALIAQPQKEEFIDTPAPAARQSLIGNAGTFELSPDGALTGTGKRKYLGHSAQVIRTALLPLKSPAAALRYFGRLLNADFKLADDGNSSDAPADKDNDKGDPDEHEIITITHISGLDEGGDIDVDYKLNLAGYAVATGDRLIIRPSVFRYNFKSPFITATRTTQVHFPYPWQELDLINIKLPPGYAPEIEDQPPSSPTPLLFYRNKLNYDPAAQTLRLRREFSCQSSLLPVTAYAAVKTWFDEMVRGDQYELVLAKSAAVAAATTEPATPAAPVVR